MTLQAYIEAKVMHVCVTYDTLESENAMFIVINILVHCVEGKGSVTPSQSWQLTANISHFLKFMPTYAS